MGSSPLGPTLPRRHLLIAFDIALLIFSSSIPCSVLCAVEGVTFAFGPRGTRVLVGAELLVLTYRAGPALAAGTAAATLFVCAVGRGIWALLHTVKEQGADLESIADVFDWEPPKVRVLYWRAVSGYYGYTVTCR